MPVQILFVPAYFHLEHTFEKPEALEKLRHPKFPKKFVAFTEKPIEEKIGLISLKEELLISTARLAKRHSLKRLRMARNLVMFMHQYM